MEETTTRSLHKSLGMIRRKAVDLAQFSPVRESVLAEGQPLPLIIEPAADQVDLVEWANNNRPYIQQKLHKHGGVLFRGFAVRTAPEFQRVASALCGELYADYGDLPRESLAEKVYS